MCRCFFTSLHVEKCRVRFITTYLLHISAHTIRRSKTAISLFLHLLHILRHIYMLQLLHTYYAIYGLLNTYYFISYFLAPAFFCFYGTFLLLINISAWYFNKSHAPLSDIPLSLMPRFMLRDGHYYYAPTDYFCYLLFLPAMLILY